MGEGKDLPKNILEVLPGDVSAYFSVNDYANLKKDFQAKKLYQTVFANDELYKLILSNEEYKKYKEDRKSESVIKSKIEDSFIEKWFGEELVVAVVKLEGIEKPAVYVISRTNPGIIGRLAELAAKNSPSHEIFNKEYHSKKIYIYRDKKEDDSYTYCKYGQTIILSLLGEETVYLEKFIDNLKDGKKRKYNSNVEKHLYSKSNKTNYLAGYLEPNKFKNDFKSFIEYYKKEDQNANLDFFNENFGKFDYILIASSLTDVFNTDVKLYFSKEYSKDEKNALYPTGKTKHNLLKYVPADTLLLFSMSNKNLREELDFRVKKTLSSLEIFEGIDVKEDEDNFAFVKDEFVFTIDDIKQVFIFPVPLGKVLFSINDEKGAEEAAKNAIQSIVDKYQTGSQISNSKVAGFNVWEFDLFSEKVSSFSNKDTFGIALGKDTFSKSIELSSNKVMTIENNDLFKKLSANNSIDDVHTIVFLNTELMCKKAESLVYLFEKFLKEQEDTTALKNILNNIAVNAKSMLFLRKNYDDYVELNIMQTVE